MSRYEQVEGSKDFDLTQPFRFVDIQFPTGIKVRVTESEKNILFEPVSTEAKIIPFDQGGGYFKPGGQRA